MSTLPERNGSGAENALLAPAKGDLLPLRRQPGGHDLPYPNKAVFLDRDGTINVDRGYTHRICDFRFIPGAQAAIRLLNRSGYMVFVVTNQSGIARGYYTGKDVESLHAWLQKELVKWGAHIDAFYYCPHHPVDGTGIYKRDCECRKPKTGMFMDAIRHYGIHPGLSYTVGDRDSDLAAGRAAGTMTILVRTGLGREASGFPADFEAPDLLHAVTGSILRNIRNSGPEEGRW